MVDADVHSIVDPWFNFRATKYLVNNGFYSFWDWFDDRTYCFLPMTDSDRVYLLEMIDRNMASPWPCYGRHVIPRPHGH